MEGGGAKISMQCHGGGGGGAIFFLCILEGGGRFFLAYLFCQTTTPPPAINNERSLSHFCLFTNKCGWSIGQDFCVKDATYHAFLIPSSLSEHRQPMRWFAKAHQIAVFYVTCDTPNAY